MEDITQPSGHERSGYEGSPAAQQQTLSFATVVTASLTGFSHAGPVEASPAGAAKVTKEEVLALDDSALGAGALVHELVRRRFPGRTFRDCQGLLPGNVDVQATWTWQDFAGISESVAAGTAGRAADFRGGHASTVGAAPGSALVLPGIRA